MDYHSQAIGWGPLFSLACGEMVKGSRLRVLPQYGTGMFERDGIAVSISPHPNLGPQRQGARACCRPSRLVNMTRLYRPARPTVLGRVSLRNSRKHGKCTSYAGDVKGKRPYNQQVYGLSACCSSGGTELSTACGFWDRYGIAFRTSGHPAHPST